MRDAKIVHVTSGKVRKTSKQQPYQRGMKMKRPGFSVGLAIVLCGAMSALASAAQQYAFHKVVFPNDTFTQLLGINDFDVIAGYHGQNINKGFEFSLPDTFTSENFPASTQTQVTGINDNFKTSGFFIDGSGVTHGFLRTAGGTFLTVDYPGTGFNQLLGLNFRSQAVGYYADSPSFTVDHAYIYDANGGVFLPIINPLSVNSQATGINNEQVVCGFYVDSGGTTHGFMLNAGTLTTLDFPGANFTQALGLNDNGQVVGVYSTNNGAAPMHGFVYNIAYKHYHRSTIPRDWAPRRSMGSTISGRWSAFTSIRMATRTALLALRFPDGQLNLNEKGL
jgi:hypothetical protein